MRTVAESHRRHDAQAAFVTLLTRPLLTARANPAELRILLPHRGKLAEWATRLGYRLVINSGVIRLHRDPAGPQVSAAPPPRDPPARRDLVLQLLAAAACESTDDTTTIQELSDGAAAGGRRDRCRRWLRGRQRRVVAAQRPVHGGVGAGNA